jgi:hypothetical protein
MEDLPATTDDSYVSGILLVGISVLLWVGSMLEMRYH